MPVSLSIIIVSYNVKYFLEQCLHTVRRAAAGMQVEVIVVDNASADGSLAYLEPLFPDVQFVANQTNVGFAKACNQGFRLSQGSYVLFLNPDVLLGEDTLHKAVSFLQQHPDAGAAGVHMMDGNGRYLPESKRGYPSPLASFFKLSGFARLFPRSKVFSGYYLGHLDEQQNHRVDVLAGAFMMIRRSVLEKTGAFDEAFFMYGEDIDLSYRIRLAGYHNYYLAETSIIHFKGESTQRTSLRYVQQFYQAMSIFVRKHYRGSTAGMFSGLLQTAIWLRAGCAAMGRLAYRLLLPAATQPAVPLLPVAIYASPTAYKKLAAVYRQQGIATLRLKSLGEAGMLGKGQELVLSLSQKTMTEYINWMQQKNFSFHYRFHTPDCGSIIGSRTCTSTGEITLLHQQAQTRPEALILVN